MASRCVASTRGEVELWGGRPIRANYSANCGGISADVWEAWPADPVPYLVSRADRAAGHDYCETSPNYRWREEWTPEEFLSDLSRYGREQGVRLPQGGLGSLVDVRVEARSPSGRVWRLVVETTSGQVVVPAYSLRRVLRRSGQPDRILRSNLFKIDVRRDPSSRRPLTVVASGSGSGHGVGLCQTGALGMARRGARGEAILAHYYPGATLQRLY
jgi:stage II sporulation protein D